jgi:innexin
LQILNIVMVDKFLGGSFLSYGTEVIKYANMDQENRSDPMIEVFPRITKCTCKLDTDFILFNDR